MNPEGWDTAIEAAQNGNLYKFLQSLTRTQLHSLDPLGRSLLHIAASFNRNENAIRYLISSGLAMNAITTTSFSHVGPPIFAAASLGLVENVRVLCAAGANLRLCLPNGANVLQITLRANQNETAKFLIANGLRLSTVAYKSIPPELRKFEEKVLQLRSAITALICGNRVAQSMQCDKHLIMEIALAAWSARF